jgi:hypothetical protein
MWGKSQVAHLILNPMPGALQPTLDINAHAEWFVIMLESESCINHIGVRRTTLFLILTQLPFQCAVFWTGVDDMALTLECPTAVINQ